MLNPLGKPAITFDDYAEMFRLSVMDSLVIKKAVPSGELPNKSNR